MAHDLYESANVSVRLLNGVLFWGSEFPSCFEVLLQ